MDKQFYNIKDLMELFSMSWWQVLQYRKKGILNSITKRRPLTFCVVNCFQTFYFIR